METSGIPFNPKKAGAGINLLPTLLTPDYVPDTFKYLFTP